MRKKEAAETAYSEFLGADDDGGKGDDLEIHTSPAQIQSMHSAKVTSAKAQTEQQFGLGDQLKQGFSDMLAGFILKSAGMIGIGILVLIVLGVGYFSYTKNLPPVGTTLYASLDTALAITQPIKNISEEDSIFAYTVIETNEANGIVTVEDRSSLNLETGEYTQYFYRLDQVEAIKASGNTGWELKFNFWEWVGETSNFFLGLYMENVPWYIPFFLVVWIFPIIMGVRMYWRILDWSQPVNLEKDFKTTTRDSQDAFFAAVLGQRAGFVGDNFSHFQRLPGRSAEEKIRGIADDVFKKLHTVLRKFSGQVNATEIAGESTKNVWLRRYLHALKPLLEEYGTVPVFLGLTKAEPSEQVKEGIRNPEEGALLGSGYATFKQRAGISDKDSAIGAFAYAAIQLVQAVPGLGNLFGGNSQKDN